MKRKGIIMLIVALCIALFASAALAVDVATKDELLSALNNGGEINITQDIPDGGLFQITRDTNINLNGHTITRNYSGSSTGATPVFYVTNGKLTLSNGSIISNNSLGTAEGVRVQTTDTIANASAELNDITITSDSIALSIYGDVSGGALEDKPTFSVSATINGKSALFGKEVGAFVIGKQAALTLNDGEIKSEEFGISGNGTRNASTHNGGTVVTINGGTVISEQTCAIYQPQAGTITITGGTVTGYDGIQMKSGTLNMTGGVLKGTGAFDDDYTYEEGRHDGSLATGAALAILSEGAVSDSGYAGEITINISGEAVLESINGYAIAEAFSNSSSESKFVGLNISGGSFIGAHDKNAVAMTNANDSNVTITGGTFSSELSTCEGLGSLTNLPTMTQDENGNFVAVTIPATDLDIDESNLYELLVGDTLQISVGQTLQLKAVMQPENANDKIVWSSSDEAVATVDQSGLVKAVSVGTVFISASITHTDLSISDEIAFTVVEATTSDDVKPQPSGSGGGGCSAGFGALALLAALPLLRMRKK